MDLMLLLNLQALNISYFLLAFSKDPPKEKPKEEKPKPYGKEAAKEEKPKEEKPQEQATYAHEAPKEEKVRSQDALFFTRLFELSLISLVG